MQRLLATPVMLTGLGIALLSASASQAEERREFYQGHVTHGINVFNDEPLVDYSRVSPGVPWLNANPLVREIGVLAPPGASDAEVITAETDRDLPMATTRSFVDFFNPFSKDDPSLFNLTLDQTGVSFFGFGSLDQRIPVQPFAAAAPGTVYRAEDNLARPTLGQWDAAGGLLGVECRSDGSARVSVTLRNGLPNGVYTLWDVGVLHPLTPQEQGYAVPFGGLPNILLTDEDGCGYKELTVPYCPDRPCEGSSSCTSYVSALYHWDHQVYGGSPDATWAGGPTGVYVAGHVAWAMSGDVLVAPQNPLLPDERGCATNHEDDESDDDT